MKSAKGHKIILLLDEDDYRDVQAELARWKGKTSELPEGRSNDAGAIIGEALRALEEYRSLHRAMREVVAK